LYLIVCYSDFLAPLLRDIKFANYDVLAPKGKSLSFTSTFAGMF